MSVTIFCGALHVQIGHNEEDSISPQKKDFFSSGNYAKIHFLRNDGGAITGFTISTGRVLNLKFAKLRS